MRIEWPWYRGGPRAAGLSRPQLRKLVFDAAWPTFEGAGFKRQGDRMAVRDDAEKIDIIGFDFLSHSELPWTSGSPWSAPRPIDAFAFSIDGGVFFKFIPNLGSRDVRSPPKQITDAHIRLTPRPRLRQFYNRMLRNFWVMRLDARNLDLIMEDALDLFETEFLPFFEKTRDMEYVERLVSKSPERAISPEKNQLWWVFPHFISSYVFERMGRHAEAAKLLRSGIEFSRRNHDALVQDNPQFQDDYFIGNDPEVLADLERFEQLAKTRSH